ncbi:MAG: di-trans,poly-cis-decaprenylcistransferase [Bifidobacteriaceae bacterium]|jgi:undecaprenyl diphosphate synthase|nr:di-trans,poly-cis-decaprenylcistransferase [Bifidobacteriaceae bacterium]
MKGQNMNFEAHPLVIDSLEVPEFEKVPKHIAVIMDGNGRWAVERGLKRTEGHKAAETAIMDVIAGAVNAKVSELSLYAFSTENWSRPAQEVRFLMSYAHDLIHRRSEELHSWNVKINWCGRKNRLWKSVLREISFAEKLTKNNTGLMLNFCINYGGRAEIVDAVNDIILSGAKKVNEKTFASHLYSKNMQDVDLLIRSSGEQRTSNFLIWQSTYAELMFIDKFWPDIRRQDLWEAICEFGKRERRLGRLR